MIAIWEAESVSWSLPVGFQTGWSFGVQAGKESCIDPPNLKAGLDSKHSLKDWIPAQTTPPNRYALWRGPR